jgi:hypothetical protein
MSGGRRTTTWSVLYSEDGDRRYYPYPESEKKAFFATKIVFVRSTGARRLVVIPSKKQ